VWDTAGSDVRLDDVATALSDSNTAPRGPRRHRTTPDDRPKVTGPLCDFEDCVQPASQELRFELVEPGDASAIVGTFTLAVCADHARPEFVASQK
jgi:hypothetical protein